MRAFTPCDPVRWKYQLLGNWVLNGIRPSVTTGTKVAPMLEFFFADIDWSDCAGAGIDTLIMLGWSLGFTVLLGLPLGIVLYLTSRP